MNTLIKLCTYLLKIHRNFTENCPFRTYWNLAIAVRLKFVAGEENLFEGVVYQYCEKKMDKIVCFKTYVEQTAVLTVLLANYSINL